MSSARQMQYSLDIAAGGSTRGVAPTVFARLSPAVPTTVYETYWRFAAERQRIFFQRARGEQPPWSEDPILERFKFTNAYRASDRVSQFLIGNVIYAGPQTLRICSSAHCSSSFSTASKRGKPWSRRLGRSRGRPIPMRRSTPF